MHTSISAVFPANQRLLLSLQHSIGEYERGVGVDVDVDVSSINSQISQLVQSLSEMELLCAQEGQRREAWRSRLKQMNDELNNLRSSFLRIQQKQQQRRNSYRQQLLSDDHSRKRGNREQTTASHIDSLSREHDSLVNSSRMIDEFTSMSQSSLDNLHRQRGQLTGVKRKVMDVFNSVGLSGSLLRMIEREETFNACLVASGIVVTCTVVAFTWWYFVRGR